MVTLSEAQAERQAGRLSQAVPALAAAYGHALARWQADPVLSRAGRPIVTESYRSPERQEELYAQGRSKPGPVVTYKRGGESKHNGRPARALDVAFLLPDGSVSWAGLLLSKFARLVKAADARVRLPRRGPRRLSGGVQGPAAFRGTGLSWGLGSYWLLFTFYPFFLSLMKLWQILIYAAVNVILQLVDKKRDRAGK